MIALAVIAIVVFVAILVTKIDTTPEAVALGLVLGERWAISRTGRSVETGWFNGAVVDSSTLVLPRLQRCGFVGDDRRVVGAPPRCLPQVNVTVPPEYDGERCDRRRFPTRWYLAIPRLGTDRIGRGVLRWCRGVGGRHVVRTGEVLSFEPPPDRVGLESAPLDFGVVHEDLTLL